MEKHKAGYWIILIFTACAAFFVNPPISKAQFMRGLITADEKSLSQPPEIKQIPRYTSELYVVVKGKTFPGALVLVRGGSSLAQAVAHPVTGEFEVEVFLEAEKINRLEIVAIDRLGRSTPPAVVEVEQTLTPAEAPIIYDYVKYTNKNLVKIKGKTRAGYQVVAYGGKYPSKTRADENGEFEIAVYLNPNSLNKIRIAAIDRVGNMSPFSEAAITHDSIPPYPPAVTRYPTKTRKTVVTVEGTAEAGGTVIFDDSVKIQTLPVDEFGRFKGKIKIEKFALSSRTNRILVYAVDRAGNKSKPTEIIITHVHFFRKHMVYFHPGFHVYPGSDFFDYLGIKNTETFGPAFAVSYNYVVKSPFSIGVDFGSYGSTGNTISEELRSLKIYTLGWYFIVKPGFHLMLEKFDIYASVGAGVMVMHKFWKMEQEGGIRKATETYPTWVVKVSAGVDYYVTDFISVGFEESYFISFINNFSLLTDQGTSKFDAGGNVFTLNVGLHL